jgi:hypothetical protein
VTVTAFRKTDLTAAARARRYRRRRRQRAVTVAPRHARGRDGVTVIVTLAAALALTCISGFFGIVGMSAVYAAATVPITVMVGVLEAAKLTSAGWLARHWQTAPLQLRAPLVVMVLLLMMLTAIGTFGFLTRAHITHQIDAISAIDRDAAPLAQRIAIAEVAVRDLDGRIAQLDDMVKVSTVHGRTKTAMALIGDQSVVRADLIRQRQIAAENLGDLKVELSGIEAQRARVAGEAGPALYLARLFGSDDTESTVRIITALLVLVLDPLAILLVLAATRGVP